METYGLFVGLLIWGILLLGNACLCQHSLIKNIMQAIYTNYPCDHNKNKL